MLIKGYEKQKANSPEKIAEIFKTILNLEDEHDRDKEHVWIMGLNSRLYVRYIDLISLGSQEEALIHPVEVFRYAVMRGVYRIIVVHNHPSNSLQFSTEDMKLYNILKEASKVLEIKLLDFIVITTDGQFINAPEN